MVARQIRVSGRVQGVGYRASLQHVAREHSVSGWVRNRSDGSVEALLQGSTEAVEALIAWAQRGPPDARIADVAVTAMDEQPAHADFEIRATL